MDSIKDSIDSDATYCSEYELQKLQEKPIVITTATTSCIKDIQDANDEILSDQGDALVNYEVFQNLASAYSNKSHDDALQDPLEHSNCFIQSPGISQESTQSLLAKSNRPITRSLTRGISHILYGNLNYKVYKKKVIKKPKVSNSKPVDLNEAMTLLTITTNNFLNKLKTRREERKLAMEKESELVGSIQFDFNSCNKFTMTESEKLMHRSVLNELATRYKRELNDNE